MNKIKDFWTNAGKTTKIIVVVVIVLLFAGIGTNMSKDDDTKKKDNDTVETSSKKKDKNEKKETKKEEKVEKEDTTGTFEAEFTSGYYTAGIDFPAGTYNIVAVSGTGNVSSSNMFSGGLNEIMGISDNDMYEESFNNAKLSKDDVLKVSGGVVIRITGEKVKLDDVKERTLLVDQVITLGSGNYTAGVDFNPGVYNVVAISGTGNVSSSNMYDGGLNAIMGIGDDFYEVEYKNITFDNATTLKISGVEIQLIPVQ
ncbi:MAG: hypothetical protein ACK5LC_11055 [Coprobacillaceae bacterium]